MWIPWAAFVLASLAAALVFLGYCIQHRDQRGAMPLVMLFTGIIIWVSAELLKLWHGQFTDGIPDPSVWGEPAWAGVALRVLGVELAAISTLLLGLEYTGRERWIRPSTLLILALKPLAIIGIALFRVDLLMDVPPPPAPNLPWGFELVGTSLWMGHVVYSILLVFVGLAFLAHMMWKSNYAHRWRIFALMLGIATPLTVNALFHIGILPFDATPGSFLFTALLLMYATFQWRLMDPTPVARRTVLEQMDDLVFVLDGNGQITQVNSAVADVFERERVTGSPITDVFGDPSVGNPETGDQNLNLTAPIDGDHCQFSVTKSVLTDYRGDLLAQVLVCRDVTDKHRREEQLELLKDVQSRFLRHNLRNELNTILAHAEFMLDDSGPSREESHRAILETSDRLVQWGEKARTIERMLGPIDRTQFRLGINIERIARELQVQYPEVRFETDCDTEVEALAVPQVDTALENLVDNAARYNTSDDPWVRLTTTATSEHVRVAISDNGPGIDEAELDAIESGTETQLEHSSGFGLWLAYWVVDTSEGDISFEVDNETTVTIEFERAD